MTGGRIIARETISARNGEMLRPRHHPQTQAPREQRAGKKKMRQCGRVDIPQGTFINALKIDE